ncbi:SDR family oxidoreductase [Cohnella cellulosilytica]|uniref:SDR family oxidoreductase n=1 Tax=Cohnella cellulosilytica TaxID=986710 RepID=A0ABW2FJD8_9BACL
MNQIYRKLFELEGKTAIVTGGLGIIGREVCRGLCEFGANVAIADLNGQGAEDFAAELASVYAVQAIGLQCNVAVPSEVEAMVEETVKRLGAVHILHNNAASRPANRASFLAPFEEYSLEQWQEVMSINIDGTFLVAREVGKQMIRQGTGGSIIQTASIYGIMGPDHRIYEGSYYLGQKLSSPAVYSASKGGVVALTKYLATYWAPNKIRVNTLTPGGVESGQNEQFVQKYSARIPLGRMAEASEMVGAVVYLASSASSYVTGQNIIVDGGLNAW